MKIIRTSKCNLKYLTDEKSNQLDIIRQEYTKIVNIWIDKFWNNPVNKFDLKKDVLNQLSNQTWFSQRMIRDAAREAIEMIASAKERALVVKEEPIKPSHSRNRMQLTGSIALLQNPKNAMEFDCWLHLQSIGNKLSLDIPIRKHKHFNNLLKEGKICSTIVILKNHIQFAFEIETGPKQTKDSCIGIDTGIKTLAASSTGENFGVELEDKINRVKRCKHGSKGQQRARAALKDYISSTAKEVVKSGSLIVVENLKNISKNTKKSHRLNKSMRSVIGNWNQAYWMRRLQLACERNRVSFRTVSPSYTSRTCPICGYADKRNRKKQAIFLCQNCGHTGNADTIAARNILQRFLTGPYGAGCKAKFYEL